jgi:hypothetical protein
MDVASNVAGVLKAANPLIIFCLQFSRDLQDHEGDVEFPIKEIRELRDVLEILTAAAATADAESKRAQEDGLKQLEGMMLLCSPGRHWINVKTARPLRRCFSKRDGEARSQVR